MGGRKLAAAVAVLGLKLRLAAGWGGAVGGVRFWRSAERIAACYLSDKRLRQCKVGKSAMQSNAGCVGRARLAARCLRTLVPRS